MASPGWGRGTYGRLGAVRTLVSLAPRRLHPCHPLPQVPLPGGGDLKMICIAIRKGPRACIYVGSTGTTNAEVPRKLAGKYTSVALAPYTVPNMCNLFTDGQAAVDQHNKLRQHSIRIERAVATKSFITRLDSHFSGFEFVDAYYASTFHLDTYFDTDMLEALSELSFKMIYNPVIRAEQASAHPMPGLGAAAGPSGVGTRRNHASAPVMNSGDNQCPYGSVVLMAGGSVSINGGPPTRESPGKHVLIPLAQVAGYRGPKQQRCLLCNDLCSWVCARCSTGPHAMVPLHPFSTTARGKTTQWPCLNDHRRDPTASYRTNLMKLTGISKQARKARRTTIIRI